MIDRTCQFRYPCLRQTDRLNLHIIGGKSRFLSVQLLQFFSQMIELLPALGDLPFKHLGSGNPLRFTSPSCQLLFFHKSGRALLLLLFLTGTQDRVARTHLPPHGQFPVHRILRILPKPQMAVEKRLPLQLSSQPLGLRNRVNQPKQQRDRYDPDQKSSGSCCVPHPVVCRQKCARKHQSCRRKGQQHHHRKKHTGSLHRLLRNLRIILQGSIRKDAPGSFPGRSA